MFKYIKAMSYDKKRIEMELMFKAELLTEHLIKLYLFPNSQYENHWRKEVWNFLNKVSKMKGNNKLPSYKFIFECISGYADMSTEIMYQIIGEYKSLDPVRLDSNELEAILNDYFEWLANELSVRGTVGSLEVYEKLDELNL